MKKIIIIIGLVLWTAFLFIIISNSGLLSGVGLEKGVVTDLIDDVTHKKGRLVLRVVDGEKGLGLGGRSYQIIDKETGDRVARLKTDGEGQALSKKIKQDQTYLLVDQNLWGYYGSKTSLEFDLVSDQKTLTLTLNMPDHILDYDINSEGQVIIHEVAYDLPVVYQKPFLPNGCEITAATAVLQAYGYDIDHVFLSDHYLPTADFYEADGRTYGADPNIAFAGHPKDPDSWYVFPPPIVVALNDYIEDEGGNYQATDITGSSLDQLKDHIDNGQPVMAWTTLDLSLSRYGMGWYLRGSDNYYRPYINLHCVVLYGYEGNDFLVMDPLKGRVRYDQEAFMRAYDSIGSRGVIIYNNE